MLKIVNMHSNFINEPYIWCKSLMYMRSTKYTGATIWQQQNIRKEQ